MAALMIDRAEYLSWAKDRALRYVARGDLVGALEGLTADLRRHPETADHPRLTQLPTLAVQGGLHTADQVRQFIDGIR